MTRGQALYTWTCGAICGAVLILGLTYGERREAERLRARPATVLIPAPCPETSGPDPIPSVTRGDLPAIAEYVAACRDLHPECDQATLPFLPRTSTRGHDLSTKEIRK